jgi:hypothetical protein
MDFVLDRFVAELVGFAMNHTAANAATGHPNGVAFGIVIATGIGLSFEKL